LDFARTYRLTVLIRHVARLHRLRAAKILGGNIVTRKYRLTVTQKNVATTGGAIVLRVAIQNDAAS